MRSKFLPVWSWLLPIIAIVVFALSPWLGATWFAAFVYGIALIAAVLAAVHHAEVVAHRVGEPFGTLILAIAVTVIEVALITMIMLQSAPGESSLARDTVFAAVMIVANGVLGLCLVVGGLRHREQSFRVDGASSLMAVMAALATLTLVLPTFTTSTPGPTYSVAQLIFAGVASLTLYAVFVFVQTVRHRDYFLPEPVESRGAALDAGLDAESDAAAAEHATLPSTRFAWIAFGLLLVALVAVVALAKMLAPFIEQGVSAAGAPKAVVGIAIAFLVLLPETWAAVRAARADRLQTSLNLALGSGIASIGLTVPVVGALSIWLDVPLALGLDASNIALLVLTFVVGTLTLGTGRTTVLPGAVHLVIFAAFLVLAVVP